MVVGLTCQTWLGSYAVTTRTGEDAEPGGLARGNRSKMRSGPAEGLGDLELTYGGAQGSQP